jgi:hypothetical protein
MLHHRNFAVAVGTAAAACYSEESQLAAKIWPLLAADDKLERDLNRLGGSPGTMAIVALCGNALHCTGLAFDVSPVRLFCFIQWTS